MTQVRCNGCRAFFDAKLRACPECGYERPERRGAYVGKMNDALFEQAKRAAANA